jgi:hypothetical protein
MPSITVSRQPFIGDGIFVTYLGTPNVCTYWEVFSWNDPVEGAPLGSLVEKILRTDANGLAQSTSILRQAHLEMQDRSNG